MKAYRLALALGTVLALIVVSTVSGGFGLDRGAVSAAAYPSGSGSLDDRGTAPSVVAAPAELPTSGGSSTSDPPGTYAVTFHEIGLVNSTVWAATYNGSTLFAAAPHNIVFNGAVNGTWPYGIPTVVGYTSSPVYGTIHIVGADQTRDITFAPTAVVVPTFTVTFVESGLKAGTVWSATLNGSTQFSTSDFISFSIVNGTFAFGIGTVNGYTVSPQYGTVTVNGSSTTKDISFSAITFLGLAPAEGYAVLSGLIAFAVVLVLGIAVFLVRRWRRRPRTAKPPPPAWSPPTAPPPSPPST